MATNIIFEEGDSITLPVPAGTLSGEPVLVGSLPGVALTSRDDTTGTATVRLEGVALLNVAGAITNVGDPVYIVTADRSLTATATGNTVFGYALDSKATGTAPIRVRIAEV